MPTPGSMLNAKSSEPMPRIVAESTADDPENGVPPSRLTLGAMPLNAEISATARSFSAVPPNAEIAIGTSCTFSTRFCAVTTISSMPPALSACAVSWANAGTARIDAASAKTLAEVNRAFMQNLPCLWDRSSCPFQSCMSARAGNRTDAQGPVSSCGDSGWALCRSAAGTGGRSARDRQSRIPWQWW